MLILSKSQVHGMVLKNRKSLIKDIDEHLLEYHPDFKFIYPRGYLLWVINDSIDLAEPFNLDDVYSMRLFIRLRWEIAPGFYKQPQIAAVLAQTQRVAEDRFAELTTERFAQAWEQARQFKDPSEWRRDRYWGEEP